MRIPIPRFLALVAVAASLALIALLTRTPPEPVPAPAAAVKPAAPKARPPAPLPPLSTGGSFPNSGAIAAPTVPALPSLPARARAEEKRIPPPESVPVAAQKGGESDAGVVLSTAAEVVVPAPAPPPAPPPNSVFGWGPWSDGQTPAGTPTAPAPQEPAVSTMPGGLTPAVSAAAPPQAGPVVGPPPFITPPPVATPPPDLVVRPGHGFGDKNHTHIHRGGPR